MSRKLELVLVAVIFLEYEVNIFKKIERMPGIKYKYFDLTYEYNF